MAIVAGSCLLASVDDCLVMASEAPASESTQSIPASVLAREIARVALFDLRACETPQADDYGVATLLFEMAGELAPNDVELVRRRTEAAWNWGDAPALDAATIRLIELDPGDTVAQLRLLSSRFAGLQTIEAKLAAYDRVVDSAKLEELARDPRIRLDAASIKSRFALDAALLCREQGDEQGFVQRLIRSTELDATNKDAALLALTYFEERSDDRMGRLDLLVNLLLADPLDPRVHYRLCREFASGGAHAAARRFFLNYAALIAKGEVAPPRDAGIQSGVLNAYIDGPQDIYAELNKQVARTRDAVARHRRELENAKQDVSTLPLPEDYRLDITQEFVRLMAAVMLGDQGGIKASLTDLGRTADHDATILADPLQRPEGMSDEDAADSAREELLRTQLWRATLGVDVDLIAPVLDAATKGGEESDPRDEALLAMIAAREGDFAKAREIIAPLERLEAWVEIAEGLVEELSGNFDAAAAAYRRAQASEPMTPQGAVAGAMASRVTLAHNLIEPPEVAATRSRLDRYASTIEPWVDQMVRDAKRFEYLGVRLDKPEADAMSPALATLTLRNISSRPLGLGTGRPINGRMLVAPSVITGGSSVTNVAAPEVLSLDRRLRLLPGQSIEVRFALDEGATGWVCEALSGSPSEIRARIIQGFEVRKTGVKEPGPGCLETITSTFVRKSLPESHLRPEELAAKIAVAQDSGLAPVLMAAKASLVVPVPQGAEKIVEALAKRYPSLSATAKRLVICELPPASEVPELQALDDAISAETDPQVLGLAVATRAGKLDSPLLAAARNCADPRVARLAELQARRLERGGGNYATKGTGLVKPLRDMYSGAPPEEGTPKGDGTPPADAAQGATPATPR